MVEAPQCSLLTLYLLLNKQVCLLLFSIILQSPIAVTTPAVAICDTALCVCVLDWRLIHLAPILHHGLRLCAYALAQNEYLHSIYLRSSEYIYCVRFRQ